MKSSDLAFLNLHNTLSLQVLSQAGYPSDDLEKYLNILNNPINYKQN